MILMVLWLAYGPTKFQIEYIWDTRHVIISIIIVVFLELKSLCELE